MFISFFSFSKLLFLNCFVYNYSPFLDNLLAKLLQFWYNTFTILLDNELECFNLFDIFIIKIYLRERFENSEL